VTLKTLYTYLRLLENAADMKRKMPASSPQRSLKEGQALKMASSKTPKTSLA
jgi:hypothetical protein